METVNVMDLQNYVQMGRIKIDRATQVISLKDLVACGMLSTIKHGVKLLCTNPYHTSKFLTPMNVEVTRASEGAIAAIENAGGTVTTTHFNRLALRAHLKPHKFQILPKRARPPPKVQEFYTLYEKRGYLNPEVQLRNIELGLESSEVTDRFDFEEKFSERQRANAEAKAAAGEASA
jgi:large subunit ribosomal protein L15